MGFMAFIRYFIAVPRIILNDQTCSQTDKLVYGVINSLSNNKEYCYASNSYFAKLIDVKEKTISNSINNLKRKKYIDVKFVNGKRRIYLNDDIVSKCLSGVGHFFSSLPRLDCFAADSEICGSLP